MPTLNNSQRSIAISQLFKGGRRMAKYTTPVGSCLCHYNVIAVVVVVVVFGIVRSVTKTFLFEHIHLEKLLMFGIFNFNLPKLRKILTLCITFVSVGERERVCIGRRRRGEVNQECFVVRRQRRGIEYAMHCQWQPEMKYF